jgi:membrane dipeptidase
LPDLKEYPDALAQSGLSAFLTDISDPKQVPTDDGSIRYFRSFEGTARSITAMRRRLREIDGAFLATQGSEIGRAFRERRTAVFFQCQGCEPLGEDLGRLDLFYELGLRILQLTHHDDNPFAGGGFQSTPSGLTKLGQDAIARMNELRVIPDLAHASDMTARDVLKASKRPVILSHGAARSLLGNARCAPDDVIRGIGESGGVMGIFMLTFWLTEDPVPMVEHVVRHIRHVENVAGSAAVGIGNDLSVTGYEPAVLLGNDTAAAVKEHIPWWESVRARGVLGFEKTPTHYIVPELNNVHRMFTLQHALERAGHKSSQIERILGGNWIRVLTDVLG